MDELLSEKEQIEQMRAWWSDYGAYVIGGVVLGASILFGFSYYERSQVNDQVAASALYDQLTRDITEDDLEASEATATEIDEAHGNSSYNAQSKLAMARMYMDKNQDQDAATALQSLLEIDGHDNLKHIGRIRLAKIYLYQDKAEDALALLEGQENDAFAARYSETRGDAYVALGRTEEARAAYQASLTEAQPTIDQGLIQLKLMDLPRVPLEEVGAGDTDEVDEAVTDEAATDTPADSEAAEE